VKELLSQAGVPYVVKDVELDLESCRELLARGFRTVPVTLVGEDPGSTAIIGFNEEALRQALGLDAG
jgi:glutaredoxin